MTYYYVNHAENRGRVEPGQRAAFGDVVHECGHDGVRRRGGPHRALLLPAGQVAGQAADEDQQIREC